MVYPHLEIISTLEESGGEFYLVRTVKSGNAVIYHTRANACSKAACKNPISDLEDFISRSLSSKEPPVRLQ